MSLYCGLLKGTSIQDVFVFLSLLSLSSSGIRTDICNIRFGEKQLAIISMENIMDFNGKRDFENDWVGRKRCYYHGKHLTAG